MIHLGLALFSAVLSLISPAPARIESAFLRNDAAALKPLLAPGAYLSVSFSGPVAFSDVLSDEQTVLWFHKFFRSARTLGFYPDTPPVPKIDHGAFVFKARWEVQSGEDKPVAYDVLFLLCDRLSGAGSRRSAEGTARGIWTILQIRAEQR